MSDRNRSYRGARDGFTLVELLIVVIILAILAAIVVPQFIASTDDAREAAVDTNLRNMRAAIDLYYQQHNEYPSANGDGVNAAGTNLAFISQMTQFTDNDGDVAATKNVATGHIYGPYLRRSSLPADPIKNVSTLVIVPVASEGTLPVPADAGDPGGWKFDKIAGQIILNHASYADR